MDLDEGESRRILVTGGTGFIGRALVQALCERGHQVTALGRNRAALDTLLRASPPTGPGSLRFLACDLRDRQAVIAACAGQQIVYHVGALTSPWGDRRAFDATNVAGTASVIMGCREHGVERLIHVSSPSVVFAFHDQFDLPDTTPYPRRFSSEYARSKALAETLVLGAARRGLPAVIVRPRAVFGPGDTTLFPRLLRAARLGRLPRIGDGDAVTVLTYLDNVIHALLLAMHAPNAVGRVCTITNEQPVPLWSLVDQVLATQDLHLSDRAIPLPVALAAAGALETAWRLLRLQGEPPVTRYSIGLLGYSETFDGRAAQEALGYKPIVSLEEGIARTLSWLQSQGTPPGATPHDSGPADSELALSDAAPLVRSQPRTVLAGAAPTDELGAIADTSVSGGAAVSDPTAYRGGTGISSQPQAPVPQPVVQCQILAAGYCRQFYHYVEHGAPHRQIALPATFALLQHPEHGVILFDTGYAPRSKDATARWPFVLYERLIPVTVRPEWSAVAQLARRGIVAEDVRYVIVSHFHADHVGGLRDFPRATFIATQTAYDHVQGLHGWRALRAAFVPALLPGDFADRLWPIAFVDAPLTASDAAPRAPRPVAWSAFPRALDLFGDASILLVPLPGHAAGQIGALVRSGTSTGTLLAADGSWTTNAYRERRMPSRLVTPLMEDWPQARRTLRLLHAVWRTKPNVTIVPTHCPELHDALLAEMDVPPALRPAASREPGR